MPKPISVHIFGLRWRTEAQPRLKKGQPAHRTMGSESSSSIQLCVAIENQPKRCPHIASTVTMMVKGSVHQKRRLKSFSSGFSSSSSEGINGSSVMPHLGQLPGWSWRTSGCMGQV